MSPTLMMITATLEYNRDYCAAESAEQREAQSVTQYVEPVNTSAKDGRQQRTSLSSKK